MRDSSEIKSMEGKTAKRKSSACWPESEEATSVPRRKLRRLYTVDMNGSPTNGMEGQTAMRKRSASSNHREESVPTKKPKRLDTAGENSSVTKSVVDKNAERKRSACCQDSEEAPSVQTRKLKKLDTTDVSNSRRSVSISLPLQESAAREQTAEVIECMGVKKEPERQGDDRNRSALEGEHVSQNSLVANSSDGPHNEDEGEEVDETSMVDNSCDGPRSVQEGEQFAQHSLVANASYGPHNYYEGENVAEHSSTDNSGDQPRSAQEDGEFTEGIHMEPPKRQGECGCEAGEPSSCEYILGHV